MPMNYNKLFLFSQPVVALKTDHGHCEKQGKKGKTEVAK
jgi:hypothetical protein